MRKLWIDGRFADSSTGATIQVVDPATEEPVDVVPKGGPADLDRLEDGSDRGEGTVLSVREKCERALLRVRARLTLVCDDVHAQSLGGRG